MTHNMEMMTHTSMVNMLKGQLMTNGIHNERILSALAHVDRSQFVPKKFHDVAYTDDDINLCGGRFLLEPLIFARLLQYADIESCHKVLDVGAGLGYGSAVMAQIAEHVTATEENSELVSHARKKLSAEHVDNVDIVTAPLTSGCSGQQPYDRIVVEGCLYSIPECLEKQLADNGIIVAIKANYEKFATKKALGTIIVGHKKHNKVSYIDKEHVCAYPLSAQNANEAFTF